MRSSLIVLALSLLALSTAVHVTYPDATCQKYPTSRAEMKAVNQAKMLSLGDHACSETYIKMFPNGTQQSVTSYPSRVNSYYDATRGALHSDYYAPGAPVGLIDEYSTGTGKACIDLVNTTNANYYTESIDQNKNGLGSVWRAIGYYTPDAKKSIKGIQWLVPTVFGDTGQEGDVLAFIMLDANNRLDYIVLQTCTKL